MNIKEILWILVALLFVLLLAICAWKLGAKSALEHPALYREAALAVDQPVSTSALILETVGSSNGWQLLRAKVQTPEGLRTTHFLWHQAGHGETVIVSAP